MINIFSVSTHKGFGIGTSLIQAIKHYEEHNGKLLLSDSKLGGAKIMIEFLI